MKNNLKVAGKILFGLLVAFIAINRFGSTEHVLRKR